ncbi:hypothetical protein PEC18_01740 [Paucibacter sp. O1-1]|nr:hypothetical protein [Paucibacter sp. O1-1]MDA3824613.1 hypothetical protein [Paucibacter sp. O1-1]
MKTDALQTAFKTAVQHQLDQSSEGGSQQASSDMLLRAAAAACRELLAQRWAATQAADARRRRRRAGAPGPLSVDGVPDGSGPVQRAGRAGPG